MNPSACPATPATDSIRLLDTIRQQVATVIVGQHQLVDRLLLALLCDGHVLVEGIPGVAKTMTVNCLAQSLHASSTACSSRPTCCRAI